MDERSRSQELDWDFLLSLSTFPVDLLMLRAHLSMGGICLWVKTVVQIVLGFPAPVSWDKWHSVPVQLFPLCEGNLYVRKKNRKLPLEVNPMVEQA